MNLKPILLLELCTVYCYSYIIAFFARASSRGTCPRSLDILQSRVMPCERRDAQSLNDDDNIHTHAISAPFGALFHARSIPYTSAELVPVEECPLVAGCCEEVRNKLCKTVAPWKDRVKPSNHSFIHKPLSDIGLLWPWNKLE